MRSLTLADIAAHPTIQGHYTVLAEAAESVASPQIRNVGTLAAICVNVPAAGTIAILTLSASKGLRYLLRDRWIEQVPRNFWWRSVYIVHPSDTAPALIALGATVKIVGPNGDRTMPLEDFFVLPDVNPQRENVLEPNEVLTEVHVPQPKMGTKSTYLKVRERGSFDFALVSVAAFFEMSGTICSKAKPRPRWRSPYPLAVQGS